MIYVYFIVLDNFLVFRISGGTSYFSFAHSKMTFSCGLIYIDEFDNISFVSF